MTQRERQASTTMSDAVPRPGHPETPRPQPAEAAPHAPLWDEIFPHTTPAQQKELLELSRRQGVVYSHQLPAVANGAAGDPLRLFLTRLLTGKAEELEPIPLTPVEFVDTRLDAAQREAVARALTTPDICLIQGLPGTGKSLVVSELVNQAVLRGQRVLLLGLGAASIDRVLEPLAGRRSICAVRCVASGESVEAMPTAIRRLTMTERCGELRKERIPAAQRELELAEQRLAQRGQDEALFQRLSALAEDHGRLREQTAQLEKLRASALAEVEAEATAAEELKDIGPNELAGGIASAVRSRQEALASLEAGEPALLQRQEACQKEREALAPEMGNLRPLGEAKQQGRWWTATWWQATFAGNVPARLAELESRCREIEATLAALDEEKRQREEQRHQAEETFRQERQRQIDVELGRRNASLDEQAKALARESEQLLEKWHRLCRDLSSGTAAPASLDAAAVSAAQQSWLLQRERDEQQLAFGREWVAGLQSLAENFPIQMAGHANLAASTCTGLAADPYFGDSSGISFDLLVIEEAPFLTESEFLAAARRARRWVLVGEPELESPTPIAGANPERPRHRSPASLASSPRLFQRLWQSLHFDPRTLPYSWEAEGDRLCCRLRPIRPEQRQWLEVERVADFPDIELRILALPRSRPVLAEVVFPPSMSIYQAKEYIFRELQELPVRALSRGLRWEETPERLVLRMCDGETEDAVAVDLGAGVREMVASAGGNAHPEPGAWHTDRLEFDRRAGWQRPQAEEWVHRHIGARDPGRTIRLDVPHRMHPELAAVLSGWLFAGAYQIPRPLTANALPSYGAPVQFVPVPSTNGNGSGRAENGRRSQPGSRNRSAPRGGAGLELDLADPRHRDRLPTELRPGLPARGLVNFLEAQAVVRALEKLAEAPNGLKPAVGVLALYPAQAELIRCLVGRSSVLVSSGLDIMVDVPEAFRERECSIALLSLTRSHHHRAVTFGEGPHLLTLALTRARSRLVLFGDPGTLARRVQWEGAVDHLNEASAARERELLSHLVRYFHSGGDRPESAPVHEGSRS